MEPSPLLADYVAATLLYDCELRRLGHASQWSGDRNGYG